MVNLDSRIEEGVDVLDSSSISRLQIAPFMGLMNMIKAKYMHQESIYKTLLALLFDHDPEVPENHEKTQRYICLLIDDEDLAELLIKFLPRKRQTTPYNVEQTEQTITESSCMPSVTAKGDAGLVDSTTSSEEQLSNNTAAQISVNTNLLTPKAEMFKGNIQMPSSTGTNPMMTGMPSSTGTNPMMTGNIQMSSSTGTNPMMTGNIQMSSSTGTNPMMTPAMFRNVFQCQERPSILYPHQSQTVSFTGGYPFLPYNCPREASIPWMYMPGIEPGRQIPAFTFPPIQTPNSVLMSYHPHVNQERSLDLSKSSPLFSPPQSTTTTSGLAQTTTVQQNQQQHQQQHQQQPQQSEQMRNKPHPAKKRFHPISIASLLNGDNRPQSAREYSQARNEEETRNATITVETKKKIRLTEPEQDADKVKSQRSAASFEKRFRSLSTDNVPSALRAVDRSDIMKKPSAINQLDLHTGSLKLEKLQMHSPSQDSVARKIETSIKPPASDAPEGTSKQLQQKKTPHPTVKLFEGSCRSSGHRSVRGFPYSQEIRFPDGHSSIINFKGDSLPDRCTGSRHSNSNLATTRKEAIFTFPVVSKPESEISHKQPLKPGTSSCTEELEDCVFETTPDFRTNVYRDLTHGSLGKILTVPPNSGGKPTGNTYSGQTPDIKLSYSKEGSVTVSHMIWPSSAGIGKQKNPKSDTSSNHLSGE